MAGYIPTGCMVCGQPPHADPVPDLIDGMIVSYHTYVPQQMTRTSPAWRAIRDEADRLGQPTRFRWDLWVDYQTLTDPTMSAGHPFLWGVRGWGTHLLGSELLRTAHFQNIGWSIRWYLWDGAELHRICNAMDAQRRLDAAYANWLALGAARKG